MGQFALLRDGAELPSPAMKKAQLLVAYLALHPGHEFHRDDLSSHLWPDVAPDAARFNLRQLLARIRKAAPDLSPHLAAEDRTSLKFEAQGTVTDVAEFTRLAEGEPGAALSRYRGSLLDKMDDDWVNSRRAALEELYVSTLTRASESADAREAVRLLRRAAEVDPFREPIQQRLMTRLAECGDLSGVQLAYRRFQSLLHREIHAQPSTETVRLYRSLIEERERIAPDPAPARGATSSVPVPPNDIVGREAEILEVRALIARERLVTLLGPGGVGKTRLAIEVGSQELGSHTGGVWFVDFSSARGPTLAAATIGQTLGLHEPSGMDWPEALAEAIGASDRLLIFDNCEHIVDVCAGLAGNLLTQCGSLKILATSRIPLGQMGEQRYPLEPLALPPTGEVVQDYYLQFSALRLFVERAQLVSPRFSLNETNAPTIASICKGLDAMPLAIEMAAARTSGLSLEEIDRRLVDKLAFLKSPNRAETPRHQSLRAVMEWSYELLPEEGKILLPRLSVFEGGWTLEAAIRVCGFGALPEAAVLEALVTLVDASLVLHADGRYQFLETVRSFSAERLADAADGAVARDRHRDYFNDFCADVEAKIARNGPDSAAALYQLELDNIRAALRWTVDSEPSDVGFSIASRASHVFVVSQLDGEAARWLLRILRPTATNPGSPARLAALRRGCDLYTSLYIDENRSEKDANAVAACRELIELAKSRDDKFSLAHGLGRLGDVARTSDSEFARDCLRESIEISRSLPEGQSHAALLALASFEEEHSGSYVEALPFAQESLREAERVGDRAGQILALQRESYLLRELFRFPESLSKLRRIQGFLLEWPDSRAAGFTNMRLAEFYLNAWELAAMPGPIAAAKAFYESCRSRFHEMFVDGLIRYHAAFEGRSSDAALGLSAVLGKLVTNASVRWAAWWHGSTIHMEALALALAKAEMAREGAVAFGAAQALRAQDPSLVSPCARSRWRHLSDDGGFEAFGAEIEAGQAFSPEEAVAFASEQEAVLLRSRVTRSVVS